MQSISAELPKKDCSDGQYGGSIEQPSKPTDTTSNPVKSSEVLSLNTFEMGQLREQLRLKVSDSHLFFQY